MSKINKNQNLEKKVMAQVESGQVKMLPKWYFYLASILLWLSVIVLLTITLFLLNLIIFRFRIQQLTGISFTGPFLWHFLRYRFPWLIFSLSIGGFYIALQLLKKFDFSYRKNWQLIVLGLLIALLISGAILDRIGLNERLQKRRLLRPLYHQQAIPPFPGSERPRLHLAPSPIFEMPMK